MWVEEQWQQISVGSSIPSCGKKLILGGGEITNDHLDSSVSGNALYSSSFIIHNSGVPKMWSYCASLTSCEGNGVLQRNDGSSRLTLIFIKFDANADPGPDIDAPLCGDNCGADLYVTNQNNQVLTVENAYSLKWKSLANTTDQIWHAVAGTRPLYEVYYSKAFFTAMAKLPVDSDVVVMDLLVSDPPYVAANNFKEWVYEPSTITGSYVLRLSYSTLETGQYYLGSAADGRVLAVQGLENAIHVTIGTSPVFDPDPVCEPANGSCLVSGDCCPPLACNADGKCVVFDEDATPVTIEWWVWVLVVLGGLFFVYIIYKLATMIGKVDTDKYFK